MRAAVVCLCVALFALCMACGGGGGGSPPLPPPDAPDAPRTPPDTTPPQAVKKPAPPAVAVDWSKVGPSATVGDVQIKAGNVWVGRVIGQDRFGDVADLDHLLIVRLELTNTSKAKIVNFGGWQDGGKATVTDEHGNRYRFADFPSGFSFSWHLEPKLPGAWDRGSITAGSADLYPGKQYLRYLFIQKPVDAAREARLTLPASSLGGTGVIRLRAPIDRPRIR